MSDTNFSDEERETGLPLAKITMPTPQPSARELELESRLESLEEDHRLQLEAFEAAHLAQTAGRIAALHEQVRELNGTIDALEAEKHRLEVQNGELNANIVDLHAQVQALEEEGHRERKELRREIAQLTEDAEAAHRLMKKVAELEFTVGEQRRIVGRFDHSTAMMETEVARLRMENEQLRRAVGKDEPATTKATDFIPPRASDFLN